MKLTTPTKPLLDALEVATLALASRTTLPVLTCALFEIGHNGAGASITCDSLDARITVDFEGATFDEPFSFLAPPRLLKAALRGEEATLTFDAKTRRLTVLSGGESKLATMSTDEFPPPWKAVERQPVDSLQLLTAIKATSACAGVDTSRYVLMCVHWDKQNARAVATDGAKLILHPLELDLAESFTLPAEHAKLLLSCFRVGDEITMGRKDTVLCLSSKGRTLWAKLHDGNYVNYAQVIPDGKPFAVVNREQLTDSLRSLAGFLDENNKVFIVPDERWTLTVKNSVGDESQVSLEATQKTKKAEPFTANARNIVALLSNWACDEVEATVADNCVVFRPVEKTGQLGLSILFRA